MHNPLPIRVSSRRRLARALALALAALSLPSSVLAAQVWVAPSTERLRPSAAARSATAAVLSAGRNEFEAFQVAVTGATGAVRATATPLAGPGTLPAPRLYRAAVIQLGQSSAPDGATGAWFDALVPDVDDVVGEKRNAFPFDVPAGETRVIWVEYHVPPDAAPGAYHGQVVLTAGGAPLATVPVTFTVRNFGLPSTASLRSHFGMYYGELAAQHGLSGEALYALRARYAQLGLDHRISLGAFEDGGRDLALLARVYGPLIDGTAPTQLAGAKLTSVQFVGARTAADYRSWADLFRSRGWLEQLFDYTCDEPPVGCAWSDIPARNALAKAADPGFRSLVTTTIQEATTAGVASSVDVLSPVINFLDGKSSADPGGWDDDFSGVQRPKYEAFLGAGPAKQLWTYQSCMSHGCGGTSAYFTGWPSYMIDAAGTRARAEEWSSFLWGLDGELYWAVTWQYSYGDPWVTQYQFSGNGDGTILYPGTPAKIGGQTHIPVASIRLKLLREGMEDYEYLKLLSDLGDPALARQVASTLFPTAWTVPSTDALLAARDTIARRVEELSPPWAPAPGGGTPTPTPTPTPDPSPTPTPTAPPATTPPSTPDPTPTPIPAPGDVDGGTTAVDGAPQDPGGGGTSGSGTAPVLEPTSGCSSGPGAEVLAALGLVAAAWARRRRS